jgi:hypothetical protein
MLALEPKQRYGLQEACKSGDCTDHYVQIIGFVRATAPVLKLVSHTRSDALDTIVTVAQRDNITINAICPCVVPTRNIPQFMRDVFGEKRCVLVRKALSTGHGVLIRYSSLTPTSTILAGYLKFLNDASLNGEIAEASRDQILLQPRPPYMDGDYTKRASTVFDPLFEMIHGQPSQLEDIVRPLS